MTFRLLNADEIEARVATVKQNGLSLLLYKDARCDMNILDESVGSLNWQRTHSRDNANCTVSIWDKDKKQWISKEDTGTESFTEKEKGLASDSFKRACFNWGIGRELYTAPFIWVPATECKIVPKGQGFTCYDRFYVAEIGYDDKRRINHLIVNHGKTKKTVFALIANTAQANQLQKDILKKMCEKKGIDIDQWLSRSGKSLDTITEDDVGKMQQYLKDR